jgi:hypothetical protein
VIKVGDGAARRLRRDGRAVVGGRVARVRLPARARSSVGGRVGGRGGGRRCMQLGLWWECLGGVGCASFVVVVVAVGIGYAKTTQRARQAEVAVHGLAITMLRRGRVTGPSQGQTRPGASLSGYEICGVSDEMLDWSCVLHGTRGRHERLDRRLRLCIQAERGPARQSLGPATST